MYEPIIGRLADTHLPAPACHFRYTAGQYELVIRSSENENLKILTSNLILQGISTQGFTRVNPDGSCNLNITAHPSGEKESIILTGKFDTENRLYDQKMKFLLIRK